MTQLFKVFVLTFFLSYTVLYAQNGYNYYYYGSQNTLNKTAIVKIATEQVRRLTMRKKIPQSWKEVKYLSIKKIKSASQSDWIVDFNNPKIKKKKHQTLHIFISVNGEIKGANYSGH